jgi:DNA-binding transcriptional regulator YiaG
VTTTPDVHAHARRLAATGEGQRARESAGVSLPELAAAVGTSAVLLARWEAGETEPQGDAARDWARIVHRLRRDGGQHWQ